MLGVRVRVGLGVGGHLDVDHAGLTHHGEQAVVGEQHARGAQPVAVELRAWLGVGVGVRLGLG